MPDNTNSSKETALKSETYSRTRESDRIAVMITDFFGSLWFLVFCLLFFSFWFSWNLGFITHRKPFDPYPFPALEMVVSVFAIILSVSVLISQKRQSHIQKISQQVEFEVNVNAENEITQVLRMLHDIQDKLGIKVSDENLEKMKQNLDIAEIEQKLTGDDSRKEG